MKLRPAIPIGNLVKESGCKLPFFPAHWGLEFFDFFSSQKGNVLGVFQRGYKAQRLVGS